MRRVGKAGPWLMAKDVVPIFAAALRAAHEEGARDGNETMQTLTERHVRAKKTVAAELVALRAEVARLTAALGEARRLGPIDGSTCGDGAEPLSIAELLDVGHDLQSAHPSDHVSAPLASRLLVSVHEARRALAERCEGWTTETRWAVRVRRPEDGARRWVSVYRWTAVSSTPERYLFTTEAEARTVAAWWRGAESGKPWKATLVTLRTRRRVRKKKSK